MSVELCQTNAIIVCNVFGHRKHQLEFTIFYGHLPIEQDARLLGKSHWVGLPIVIEGILLYGFVENFHPHRAIEPGKFTHQTLIDVAL